MRGSTDDSRGYDHTHRKTRAALIPQAIGTMCPGANGGTYRSPKCVGMMLDPAHMQLDHTIPLILGGGGTSVICCGPCNMGAGGRMARARDRARQAPIGQQRRASRAW